MSADQPDAEILVGNPERERAIALINDALSTGYLQIAEFEERSGRVYAARNRGELRRTLVNLPNAALLFPDQPQPSPGTAVATPPRLELDADWNAVRRGGKWQVPADITCTGRVGGGIDLDFAEATFTSPSVHLELDVWLVTVRVRLGADQRIRYDGLRVSRWSSLKDKAGPPRYPGGPQITVDGSLTGASGLTITRT
ncbi:DUF1707 SHOCT-like domain-containing protein [Millisia brevis]|uniref:DUF1707 SHOCT-like domain-containing protein n=1 Tax=Millisia brevis TaxID=264148 RepID=UPI000835C552|nr:DUF1707 domain-containing protein [Millisia brevis]